jgi:hypothetical protein
MSHHTPGSRRRRLAAGAVPALALALALSSCGSDDGGADDTGAASGTQYDTAAVTAGADWLGGQVSDGVVHNDQYDVDDLGLSVDVALSLHQVEQQDDVVRAVADRLAGDVEGYVAPGYGTLVSAGSAAKALVLADAVGDDPTDFGGTDLVSRVEDTVADDGPALGRVQDQLDPEEKKAADYANVVGQAYAVQGLVSEGSDEAQAAVDYLVQQQCGDGWFRLSFTADATAADQGCDADKSSTADVDATAFAVRALADSDDDAAADAVDRAVAWLTDVQAEDGSFGGAPAGRTPNSNSTGLAGAVLAAAGETDAAEQAAGWVAAHQVPDCPDADAATVGAIAYDDASLATATQKGITTKTQDQFRRASAQGLPALAWLPADSAPGDEAC